MTEFQREIYQVIKKHPDGIKARSIARELGCTRKEINQQLYSEPLITLCRRSLLYAWSLKPNALPQNPITPPRAPAAPAAPIHPIPAPVRPITTTALRSCDTCMLLRSGECNWPKPRVCEFYRGFTPISIDERGAYPENGDATAIRLGEHR